MRKTDQYGCIGCGYIWGGYNRSPPYPNCPECGDYFMRQFTNAEVELLDSGFTPARFANHD